MKDNSPWKIIIPPDEYRTVTYPGVFLEMYTISEAGLVFNNIRNFECGQSSNGYYFQVSLKQIDGSWRTISVHRLVAWEFCLNNRDINLDVNHIDGNKLNNHWTNLEWVNKSENSQHAWDIGLCKHRKGDDSNYHILTNEDVHLICQMLQDPKTTYVEIANTLKNKVHWNTIQGIANGYNWKHISNLYNIPPRSQICCSNGIDNYAAKLTNEDVHLICQMLQDPKTTYVEIAKELDGKIADTTICRIANGQIWTHISTLYSIPKRRR